MIGIYKITSPSNRVYIGQSINIKKRWVGYSFPSSLHFQPKLERSLLKYGWDAHKKEIIEQCSKSKLNERETYWKQYYLDQAGGDWSKVLFCELHDKGGGPRSEQTKKKISEKAKGHKRNLGIKQSQETINKRIQTLSLIKHTIDYSNVGRKKGFSWSEEQKQKRRKPKTEETKLKMRKPRSEEAKCNMSYPKSETAKQNMKWTRPERTCPHCGKVGKGGVMDRYHFNKCLATRNSDAIFNLYNLK
jgi:group I intron endonuclease